MVTSLETLESQILVAEAKLRPLYPDDEFVRRYPIHNWSHALNTKDNALAELDYIEAGTGKIFTVDERLIAAIGGLGHDGARHLPLIGHQYEDSEHRSSVLTAHSLRDSGIKFDEIVMRAAKLIHTTRPGSPCLSDLEKALRRGDIKNVSGPYDEFEETAYLLWREDEADKPDDDKRPLEVWAETACGILNLLLEPDLAYGDFDRSPSGLSLFQESAQKNIYKFAEELGIP